MKKLWLVLWAAFILAAPVSTAAASSADHDRDGMPDRWEQAHGLSTTKSNANADPDHDRVDNRNEFREGTSPLRRDSDHDNRPDGREDSDGDGLSNAAEDRSGNDPHNPDTDGDGIGDADEHAGTVASLDHDVLTINLATGGTFSGTVTDNTDVGCGSENEAELEQGLMGWDGRQAGGSAGDISASDDAGAEDGDQSDVDYGDGLDPGDSQRMDDEHDFADSCPARWLKPGVNIREASFDSSGGPTDLGEVEFLYSR
jgi:hypothetical protein